MIATRAWMTWELGCEVARGDELHRWHDAGVGRWISQDPIGFAAGDANLYRYVGNGVTTSTDPTGLVDGNWVPSNPRLEQHFDGSSPIATVPPFLAGMHDGVIGAGAIVVGGTIGFGVGVPAGVVTGGVFVIGAIGGVGTGVEVLNDPSSENLAYHGGSLVGGIVVGGVSGFRLAKQLSPPGHEPAPGGAGWNPIRDYKQCWRWDHSKPYLPQIRDAMGTGPNPLSAAGAVATGAGLAPSEKESRR